MRILYFSQGYSPHDERFLTALAQSEHEVFFLRLDPEKPVSLPEGIKEVILPGVKQALAKGRVYEITRQLSSLLKALNPELVHAGPLHGPAYLAARTSFKPLVSMSWGSDLLKDSDSSWLMHWRTAYVLAKTTLLLADCEAVAQKAVSYGFKRDAIRIFPWGVDLEHFTPGEAGSLRRKLKWAKKRVFLSSRKMEPLYGVDVIVKAFISIAPRRPDARLLLMGKGSQEEMLRRMIDEAGLSDRVHFGGYIGLSELPDVYRSADVYISASRCDGSSVSLMEALACGKPALVSNIAGNLEWIQPGIQGWTFKDGDADDLAREMAAICETGVDAEFGARARALAAARADWRKNFQVLLDAYDQAARSV